GVPAGSEPSGTVNSSTGFPSASSASRTNASTKSALAGRRCLRGEFSEVADPGGLQLAALGDHVPRRVPLRGTAVARGRGDLAGASASAGGDSASFSLVTSGSAPGVPGGVRIEVGGTNTTITVVDAHGNTTSVRVARKRVPHRVIINRRPLGGHSRARSWPA